LALTAFAFDIKKYPDSNEGPGYKSTI
jgi:hypothetical protein